MKYVTKFSLESIPKSFAVARDTFVFTYSRDQLEYLRIENKGQIEELTRFPVIIDGSLVAARRLRDEEDEEN